MIDFVEFESKPKSFPETVAESFLGNYKHDLYQIVIVSSLDQINESKEPASDRFSSW